MVASVITECANRLQAAADQVGHPDYSLAEFRQCVYHAVIQLRAIPASESEAYPGIAHDLETARAILRQLVESASADKLEDFSRTSNVADMAIDFLKNAAPVNSIDAITDRNADKVGYSDIMSTDTPSGEELAFLASDQIYHVYPTFGREHVTGGEERAECWCYPRREYVWAKNRRLVGVILIHEVEQ